MGGSHELRQRDGQARRSHSTEFATWGQRDWGPSVGPGPDWHAVQRLAYGPLNLLPDQFRRLTPREFLLLLSGYRERDRHEFERLAFQAACILTPFIGRAVTVEELMPKDPNPASEVAEVESLLGLPPSSSDSAYEMIMAKQRQMREASSQT